MSTKFYRITLKIRGSKKSAGVVSCANNCFKEKGNYGLPSVTIIAFPFLMNIPLPCGRLSKRRPCIS